MPETKLMQDAEKAEAYSERIKKEMESAREENAKIYGYKKGGLVKSGKPKIAKKGWR